MRREQPNRPIWFLIKVQGGAIGGHGIAFELKYTQPSFVFRSHNQRLIKMTTF